MASSVDLGNLEQSVERLAASGRCSSKSEVLREGVRLVEEREKRLEALNAVTSEIADAGAGRVKSASAVFDRLTAKYRSFAEPRGVKVTIAEAAETDLERIGQLECVAICRAARLVSLPNSGKAASFSAP